MRARVRAEVRELLASLGTTTVLVTHDREGPSARRPRALLHGGRVVASGDPVELYRRPRPLVGAVPGRGGDAAGEGLRWAGANRAR
ncbi:MAG: hypothetical protein M5U19_01705 [Microthrixaceae bacterium]|nr:hypothetical protein [Microthrixaceae bacterium]